MMKRRGFSLLEVILVSALTLILSGAVVLVYITCLRTWSAGQNRIELRTALSLALDGMTQDLDNVLAIDPSSTANSLIFTSGSSQYRYYLYSPDDPGPSYNKTSYTLLKASVSAAYGVGAILATGVQPAVFSYSNKMVIIDLKANQGGNIVHMRTQIRPRNLP